jgi:hypothetical protein
MKLTEAEIRIKAIKLIRATMEITPKPLLVMGILTEGKPNPAPGDLTERTCDLCGVAIFNTRLNELIKIYTVGLDNPSILCCPRCMERELSAPNSIAYHV